MPPKQSVETHSVWFLVPPPDHPGVNWSLLPDGGREVEPVGGFYGWVVEFHNHISDTVVQDGHQALCNLKALLLHLKERHPQLCTATRETDGAVAYNSVGVALFTASLGEITGIRIVEHSHNEPGLFGLSRPPSVRRPVIHTHTHTYMPAGHGSDICDTAGANSVRQCMRYTKRTGISVNAAEVTQTALTAADMNG